MTEQQYTEQVNLYKEIVNDFKQRILSPFGGDTQRGTGGGPEHFAIPEHLNELVLQLKLCENNLLLSNSPYFSKYVSDIQRYHRYMINYAIEFGQKNPNEYKILYPVLNSFGINLRNAYLKSLKQ